MDRKKLLVFSLIGVVVLAVTVVIVTILSGKKAVTPDNTLTIWSPFDEADVINKISDQYLADNPTVKLSFKYIAATDAKDYEAKVVDAIANGTGPDIWVVRTDWLAKHQAKLIPSTNYVSWSKTQKDETKAAAEYFGANIAAQNSRDGHVYGFPLAVDSLALYINTKVVNDAISALSDANNSADSDKLSQTPVTWADIATWNQLLTKKDAKGNITTAGLALGTVGNTYAPVDVYNAILNQYGGSLYSADEKAVGLDLVNVVGKQNIASGVQALNLFSSFAKAGDPNYSWNAAQGDPVNAFANNKLAMMIGYSTLSKDIQKANKNLDTVKIVPLPQVDDPTITNKRIDSANYWTMAVTKVSNKPATAWSYLQALGTTGAQAYGQQTGKPTFPEAQDAAVSRIGTGSLGDTTVFAEQASFAPATFKPDWQVTDQIIQDMLNQAILPGQSTQSAIDSAAARLKVLLP